MHVVFEKSARSSMWLKLLHVLVAISVAVTLLAVGWYVNDLFAWIVIGLFVLISLAIGTAAFRDMIKYSKVTGKWNVAIDDRYLVWKSPINDLFQSFYLKLEQIDRIQFFLVTSGGTKSRSSKKEYFIHLRNGQTMEIPTQQGGVWVGDVFEGLNKNGIIYELSLIHI